MSAALVRGAGRLAWCPLLVLIASASNVAGQDADLLRPVGDATLRYESDSGSEVGREDRGRVRLRLYAGLEVRPWDRHLVHLRVRTGSLRNQHSPTITLFTLDDSPEGDRDLYLDLWNWRIDIGAQRVVAGRMLWPLWAPTDYLWDGDVNPTGAHWRGRWTGRTGVWTSTAFVGTGPDGAWGFHGGLAALQQRWDAPGNRDLRLAAGMLRYEGAAGAEHLRDTDLDYLVVSGSAEYGWRIRGLPVVLGGDAFRNVEAPDLGAADPRRALSDERTGWGVELTVGENVEGGDVRLQYNYARVERFAVISDYAQDTLARFAASNFRGHDLRVVYSILDDLTVMLRLGLTEEIRGPEEGERFRIDLRYVW